eukprot:6214527-Pleurochrysis_carterae.AAC.2
MPKYIYGLRSRLEQGAYATGTCSACVAPLLGGLRGGAAMVCERAVLLMGEIYRCFFLFVLVYCCVKNINTREGDHSFKMTLGLQHLACTAVLVAYKLAKHLSATDAFKVQYVEAFQPIMIPGCSLAPVEIQYSQSECMCLSPLDAPIRSIAKYAKSSYCQTSIPGEYFALVTACRLPASRPVNVSMTGARPQYYRCMRAGCRILSGLDAFAYGAFAGVFAD